MQLLKVEMEIAGPLRSRYQICCSGLPLAVYREVVAHLQQVEGVEAGLHYQEAGGFDYAQSQVGSLWIQLDDESVPLGSQYALAQRERIERILAYYGERYGSWSEIEILS